MPTLALLVFMSSNSASIGGACAEVAGFACGNLVEQYAPPPLLVGIAVPFGAMVGYGVATMGFLAAGFIIVVSAGDLPDPAGFFAAVAIGGAVGAVVGGAASGALAAQRHGGNALVVGGVTLAILSVTAATAIGLASSSADERATFGVALGGVLLAAVAAGVAQAATAHPQL